METRDFILQAHVDAKLLDDWVKAGWLIPDQSDTGRSYSEVDLARARLIRDLHDLGVNDEGIPVILDLYRSASRIVARAAWASVDDPGAATGAWARMIQIQTTIPSRYPPVVTWMLIAANCVVSLIQKSMSFGSWSSSSKELWRCCCRCPGVESHGGRMLEDFSPASLSSRSSSASTSEYRAYYSTRASSDSIRGGRR
jgi:chaperone modulatory protein CbpM